MRQLFGLFLVLQFAFCLSSPAATHYVDLNSPGPTAPYTNWSTAATNIQDAVDAAEAGDEIIVNDGVYQTGARALYGTSNRVAVTKAVTIRSLNGPALTVIKGYQVPGTTNGAEAVRCVYLTNGSTLIGFTLTNGATQTSGDLFTNQSGGATWCESDSQVVSNCVLVGNSAFTCGGGAYRGAFNNCTLIGNSSMYGGGAYSGTLSNCTLAGNSARVSGGGAYWSTLNNCTLIGNSASKGGGDCGGTLNNCTLTGNSARYGGGNFLGTLNSCTLIGNSASEGGGDFYGTNNNCILFYNTAEVGSENYYDSVMNFCCSTPPPPGSGNIDAEPQLASASHLSAGSPCIGGGSLTYATGVDIDGEAWANPPSIGCDEYRIGSVTGPLSVAIVTSYTNVAVKFGVGFQATISGRVSASRWDFGDGTVISNRPWTTHAWAAPGDYVVELRAFNESNPAGIPTTISVHVVAQPVHYVALGSVNPVVPYTNWATAATNIHDAIDAATVPGALVLVGDGVYQTGARAVYGMSNRVAVTKPVTVQSLNGPVVTFIKGYQVPGTTNGATAVRCAYLTNGSSLIGFTLTNGATQTSGDFVSNQSGGGIWCELDNAAVLNCLLTGNSAYYSGGGACRGTLNNCTFTGNFASQTGGGALFSSLTNCTLTGNFASAGGGAFGGTLVNCIVFCNTAASVDENYFRFQGTFTHCCTMPLPTGGTENISSPPLFVNTNGWANLRLQSNSPCINAGNNAFTSGLLTDLDGNPRISGGTVDIGAYEFQNPASSLSYAWLQQYALPTDGSADTIDSDSDGLNNYAEWRAGTDPTNAASVLQLLTPTPSGSNFVVTWQSVTNINYYLQRTPGLTPINFQTIATNIPGQTGSTSFLETNAPPPGPWFYRIGVQ